MQKRARRATAHFWVWVVTKVFSVATELSGSVSRHGPLCHDMDPKL